MMSLRLFDVLSVLVSAVVPINIAANARQTNMNEMLLSQQSPEFRFLRRLFLPSMEIIANAQSDRRSRSRL